MSKLTTLTAVKSHLKYDDADSDVILQLYLDAAESVIFNYVNEDWQYESVFPAAFKIAALLLVGYYDNNRNAEGTQKMLSTPDVAFIEGNYMTPAVRNILLPYRTLTAI